MLYYHQILSRCWWHCAEDCFLVVVSREITASTTVSCSDRGSVAHCLPAGVCDRGLETLSSNEILLLLSVLDVTATICLISFTFPSLYFGVVPSSGAPSRFGLLYQRDLHLKKPTVPPLCSTLACSSTNRPWPTCSSSSRLPSYHQVRLFSNPVLVAVISPRLKSNHMKFLIMFWLRMTERLCDFIVGENKEKFTFCTLLFMCVLYGCVLFFRIV